LKEERIRKRITYYEGLLDKLYPAYEALVSGGVQSYTIDDRTLTRLDLKVLGEEIERTEQKLEDLEALLDGGKARKAVAVVPHDW
jgi:hypothetical protein